jgi:hypothetical protein
MKNFKRALVASVLMLLCGSALAGKTRHVVLVISDGVRWQEVFTGADPTLLNDKSGNNWTEVSTLNKRYWNDDPEVRRVMLFPFLWGTVATKGQIFGNQTKGSVARVLNDQWFSYPGYNEMSNGVADPQIRSNTFGPNPNVSVFEWLNSKPAYAGKVEIWATWGEFHDIFNTARSHLPVRAGSTLVDRTDISPRGQLLTELYDTTTPLEDADPMDSFLHVALRDHLVHSDARLLFVGYGDTDNWAHAGAYDKVLHTAHAFDAYLADLWQQVQSNPEWKDQTTLIIATDHGRGSGPVLWRDHGVKQPGSENIWLAVIGPDTKPLGERQHVGMITQSQIAATVAELLGEDYRAFKPAAAPSLLEALSH